MSCEHAVLKLKGVPGPATPLVCAECGIRAESVVEVAFVAAIAGGATLAEAFAVARSAVLYGRWKQAEADFEARKLCTRCGSKYDGTGACSNKPCQGGRGEWCLEHHGAPFAYGVTRGPMP